MASLPTSTSDKQTLLPHDQPMMVVPSISTMPPRASVTNGVKYGEIRKASSELAKLDFGTEGKVLKLAGQMDVMKSSALFGVLGAVLGAIGGVVTGGHMIGSFMLPDGAVLGSLGMLAGGAAAFLGYRGPKRRKLERDISDNRLLIEQYDERIKEIKKEIETLPKAAPDHIEKGLWEEVNSLMQMRRDICQRHQ